VRTFEHDDPEQHLLAFDAPHIVPPKDRDPCGQPGEIFVQPVTGFQVESVHSPVCDTSLGSSSKEGGGASRFTEN